MLNLCIAGGTICEDICPGGVQSPDMGYYAMPVLVYIQRWREWDDDPFFPYYDQLAI
jgi:hypothetical protein